MNHETYSEQLNAMLDGELRATDIAPLARHITACPDCARELAELTALRAALHQEYQADGVSSEFYTKIAGLLDSERQQSEIAQHHQAAATTGSPPHRLDRRRHRDRGDARDLACAVP